MKAAILAVLAAASLGSALPAKATHWAEPPVRGYLEGVHDIDDWRIKDCRLGAFDHDCR